MHLSLAAATPSSSSLSHTDETWLRPARQPEGNPQESQLPRCKSMKIKKNKNNRLAVCRELVEGADDVLPAFVISLPASQRLGVS